MALNALFGTDSDSEDEDREFEITVKFDTYVRNSYIPVDTVFTTVSSRSNNNIRISETYAQNSNEEPSPALIHIATDKEGFETSASLPEQQQRQQHEERPQDQSSPPYPSVLKLALVKRHHSLWAEYVYNAARVLADRIDSGEIYCRGLSCLELGAASGLPGLIAGLRGARKVVISDYATEADYSLVYAIDMNIQLITPFLGSQPAVCDSALDIKHVNDNNSHVATSQTTRRTTTTRPPSIYGVGYIWGYDVRRLLRPEQFYQSVNSNAVKIPYLSTLPLDFVCDPELLVPKTNRKESVESAGEKSGETSAKRREAAGYFKAYCASKRAVRLHLDVSEERNYVQGAQEEEEEEERSILNKSENNCERETKSLFDEYEKDKFDLIFLADLIFNRSEHRRLLWTVKQCLKRSQKVSKSTSFSNENKKTISTEAEADLTTTTAATEGGDGGGVCYVTFSHHDPLKKQLDLNFFTLARSAEFQFTVNCVGEEQRRAYPFIESDGMDEERGKVFLYTLTH